MKREYKLASKTAGNETLSAMGAETILKNTGELKIHKSRKNGVKIAIVAAILCLTQTVNAQIEFERTIEGRANYEGGIGMSLSNANCYAVFSSYWDTVIYQDVYTQVRLYNEDYSFYKTLTPTAIPANCFITGIGLFCKNIFTNDDKITYLVTVLDTTGSWKTSLRVYDENQSLLKDFGEYDGYFLHSTSDNKWRLRIRRYVNGGYESDFYSLPGTAAATNTKSLHTENESTFSSPYPNPARAVITLPYQLKRGETSVMRIYSVNGQLIETKQIDDTFNEIRLNVSKYARGTYYYDVNGVSNRFIVE